MDHARASFRFWKKRVCSAATSKQRKTNPSLSPRFQRDSCKILQSLKNSWKTHFVLQIYENYHHTMSENKLKVLKEGRWSFIVRNWWKKLTRSWRKLTLSRIARILSATTTKFEYSESITFALNKCSINVFRLHFKTVINFEHAYSFTVPFFKIFFKFLLCEKQIL